MDEPGAGQCSYVVCRLESAASMTRSGVLLCAYMHNSKAAAAALRNPLVHTYIRIKGGTEVGRPLYKSRLVPSRPDEQRLRRPLNSDSPSPSRRRLRYTASPWPVVLPNHAERVLHEAKCGVQSTSTS